MPRRSRALTLLLAAACFGACLGSGPPAPAAEQQDPVAQAKKLVGAISALPELSQRPIEKLLGVSLKPAGPVTDSAPVSLEAKIASGPFAQVELRTPNPAQPRGPRMVVLEVREGVSLPMTGFDKAFIGSLTDVNPDIPPEGTVTHSVERPGQSTRFQFRAKSRTLRLVAFHRE
jgi:hypothetical protein